MIAWWWVEVILIHDGGMIVSVSVQEGRIGLAEREETREVFLGLGVMENEGYQSREGPGGPLWEGYIQSSKSVSCQLSLRSRMYI